MSISKQAFAWKCNLGEVFVECFDEDFQQIFCELDTISSTTHCYGLVWGVVLSYVGRVS